nr:LysM peptidoglycan-binding domain-containing protein [Vagococcus allomyrinae]
MALDRVSFSQSYGEIVGVIGGKGSGKSTLGAILLGKKPSEGLISGNSETGKALVLPDHRYDERTGESYTRQQLTKWGIPKKKIGETMEQILSFSELGGQFGVKMKHYSLSEKSQLAISLLLHVAPTVIYIDESLLQVKEHFYIKVFLFLEKLKELGSSIWIETEQVKRIETYCDRLIWLEFGQLKQHGNVTDVLTAYYDYYFQIKRLSLKEQQEFWEEGYQGQIEENLIEEPPETIEQSKVVALSQVEQEPVSEEPIEVEDQADTPVSESPSRRQRQPAKSNYNWLISLGLLGGLMGLAFFVLYPRLKATTQPILPQTGPVSSLNSHDSTVSATSETLPVSLAEELPGTYRVKAGESLSDIAQALGLSLADLQKWNQLTDYQIQPNQVLVTVPPIETVQEEPTIALASFNHIVKDGESLATIAETYQISLADLQAANQLTELTIYAGSQLSLPATAKAPEPEPARVPSKEIEPVSPSAEHVVAAGDTLYSIARKYGVDVMAIQQANHLQTEQLSLGQVLHLP